MDAGLQHRGRRAPGRHLRRRRPTARRRSSSPSRCSRRCSARAGRSRDRFAGAATWSAGTYQRPVRAGRRSRDAGADYVVARRLRHHRGRHRPGAPVPRVRRGRHGGRAARYGLPVVNPVGPTATSLTDVPLVGGQFFKHADAALVAGPRRARAAVPARRLRAHLPALLALPHGADLLRAAVLVHPHHRAQGRAAARERAHQLVPRHDQARPLRRLAEQQHRLGAVAPPLLGHAAADLALRRRTTRSASARWPSCPSSPAPTCPSSTRTARSSTTSPSPARPAARSHGGCPR